MVRSLNFRSHAYNLHGGGLVRLGAGMSDWAKDWRKWSRGERALAIALVVTMMAVLPLGLILGIGRPGV